MRLLDLFCGAGGAAMGYHQAGFTEIVGVDIEPQPNYPFDFVEGDALDWNFLYLSNKPWDLIHASPPCQAYSRQGDHGNRDKYPNLIAPTRQLLEPLGVPYVIENVPGAPLTGHVIELCGSMFGLEIQRHRRFELGHFPVVLAPGCNHKAWKAGRPHTITGHADGTLRPDARHSMGFRDTAHAAELMEMPWATRTSEIVEAIPPAYTKYIGEQFLLLQETEEE